jgi:acetyltransferase-like isoleucine patch superfamily enzyme
MTANNIYILGSGGFAKELYLLVKRNLSGNCVFKGFIDLDPIHNKIKIGGTQEVVHDENKFLEAVRPASNVHLYMGVGNPGLITSLSERFKEYEFPNLFADNVVFDKQSISIGRGNVFTNGCILTVDIEIGSFNVFNLSCTVGHDTIIGDCNILNPGTNISGNVNIGSGNMFGTKFHCFAGYQHWT